MSRSGEVLRDARRRSGLSQRELARRSGVAHTLISAYENGRRVPGGDLLLRLLDSAGASLDVSTSVERSRDAARQLEQVCAVAMATPRRAAGPLRYPSFRSLTP